MMGCDHAYDDAERLRIQRAADAAASTRDRTVSTRGAPCVVAKVVTGSGPSAPGFFKMEAHDVTGAEVEGGAGTLTDAGYSFIAANLGTTIPAAGTPVICTWLTYRWVFRYDS